MPKPSDTSKIPGLIQSIARHTSAKGIGLGDIASAQTLAGDYLTKQSLSMRGVSKISWSFAKMKLFDEKLWAKLLDFSVAHDWSVPGDLSVFTFSLADCLSQESSLVSRNQLSAFLKQVETKLQRPEFLEQMSLADCAQMTFALSVLKPVKSMGPLMNRVEVCLGKLTTLESCKEVCLLWSAARRLRNVSYLEALLEASRGLRNCADFNQNKVAQLCETVHQLRIEDPRLIHQIIHFVNTKHKEINSRNLYRIIVSMSQLDNATFWKRISNRLEDSVGLDFSLDQIEKIKTVYKNRGNSRTWAILELYQKTKLDASKFGPS